MMKERDVNSFGEKGEFLHPGEDESLTTGFLDPEELEDDIPDLTDPEGESGEILRTQIAAPASGGEGEDHAPAAGRKMVGYVFRKMQGETQTTLVTAPAGENEIREEAPSAPEEAEPLTEENAAPAEEVREEPAFSLPRRLRPGSKKEAAWDTGSDEEEAPAKPKKPRFSIRQMLNKSAKYSENLFVGDEILQGTDLSPEEEMEAYREEMRRKRAARRGETVGKSRYAEVQDPDLWEEEPVEEETRPRKKPRREKKSLPLPDISPKALAAIYGEALNRRRVNILVSLILSLLLLYVNLADSLNLPIFTFLWEDKWAAALLLEGLVLVTLLLRKTFWQGWYDLFRRQVGLHTIPSVGVTLTVLDSIFFILLGREGPVPCGALAALCLTATAWGSYLKARGLRLDCRTASLSEHPARLVMERDEDGALTRVMLKAPGDRRLFGSQIQEPDGVELMGRALAPVLLAGGMIFTVLAALGSGSIDRVFWCGSIIFLMASPLSATIAYGLPYYRIAHRLNQSGAALAGWDGIREIARCSRVVVSDDDLFPTGRVSCQGLSLYDRYPAELVAGYASSLIRESGSGLTKAFHDMAASQEAEEWGVADFHCYDGGGCSGRINSDLVLVGSASFMKTMEIPLPQESFVKTAMFVAINGTLAGQIVMNYKLPPYVNPALYTMMRNGLTPMMCLRDFLLSADMLESKFAMKLEKAEFPVMDDRIVLTEPALAENGALSALLTREGLGVHGDTVIGGKRLYRAVMGNALFTMAAAVIGMLLGFYLTFMGAFGSLEPQNILVFLLMWMIPVQLISRYVDHY